MSDLRIDTDQNGKINLKLGSTVNIDLYPQWHSKYPIALMMSGYDVNKYWYCLHTDDTVSYGIPPSRFTRWLRIKLLKERWFKTHVELDQYMNIACVLKTDWWKNL